MKIHSRFKSKYITIPLFALLSACAVMQVTAAQPNIVLIVTDDMGGDVPGVFGGVFAPDVTPNIDYLATEGMRFEKAHVAVAVCQPSRQTIMTGKYPPNIGAMGFTPIDTDVTTLGKLLDQAGYINGIYNKEGHVEPRASYYWSYIQNGDEAGQGRSPVRTRQMTEEFIDLADAEGSPFFLMANTTDPHGPFYMSADETNKWPTGYLSQEEGGMEFGIPSKIYTEDDIAIPEFLADVGDTRFELTQYVNSCRRADDVIGEILSVIDEKGKANDTIVIFLSDNGMPFESGKHNTYFQSTKTPLIVRWPGHIAPNTLDDTHYVSAIDLMPTLLEAIGLAIPSDLDGSSFLSILEGGGGAVGERDTIVTTHFEAVSYLREGAPLRDTFLSRGYVVYDWISLTRPKNMRCVQSDDYGYIYNAQDTGFADYGPIMTPEAMAGLNPDEWWAYRLAFLDARGSEEFYDFQIDPNGLNNLIDDPAYATLINEFRYKLRNWMDEINDPSKYEYQHIVDATTPSTYITFANITDGQVIPAYDAVLSNVELEYVLLDYVKEMTLLVDDASYAMLVRAPFTFDISALSDGNHTLQMEMLDNAGDLTYSDLVNITIGAGDGVGPLTPTTASFASVTPVSSSSILVTANEPTMATGTVQYRFWCQQTGVYSPWLTESSYTFTGLTPETSYRFKMFMRDDNTATPWSGLSDAVVTLPVDGGDGVLTPSTASFASVTPASSTAITVTANEPTQATGIVQYRFWCKQTGVFSPWLTESSYTFTDLTPETSYEFKAYMKDDNTATPWSGLSDAVMTLAESGVLTPATAVVDAVVVVDSTTVEVTAAQPTQSTGTVEYRFWNSVTKEYSAWQTLPTWSNVGLSAGTAYRYKVAMRDDNTLAAWSALSEPVTP